MSFKSEKFTLAAGFWSVQIRSLESLWTFLLSPLGTMTDGKNVTGVREEIMVDHHESVLWWILSEANM